MINEIDETYETYETYETNETYNTKEKIYKTTEYEIEQEGNIFKIQLKRESPSLLKSILNTTGLLGASISDNYKTLSFNAHSIKPIQQVYIDYNISLKIIYYLTKQLEFLIVTERKSFYKYNLSNLFIIDSKIMYLSNEYLLDIKKEKIRISIPFPKEQYDSPELLELNTIPAEIHYKTIYYTLANIVTHLLTEHIPNKEEQEQKQDTLKILEGTKLFGLLKRCKHSIPEKRSIIYV